MGKNIETDVQSAIQSQVIQTALEANTSKITDAGFQSLLQSAPIPRVFLRVAAGQTINNNTNTNITWGQAARVHDPYMMHQAANTFDITIPVSGYYTFFASWGYTFISSVGQAVAIFEFITSQSKVHGANTILTKLELPFPGAGTNFVQGNISMTLPFEQGDTFRALAFFNYGVASVTLDDTPTILGGVWNAPYSTFTTGAGGN